MKIVYKNTNTRIKIQEIVCPPDSQHLLEPDFRGYLEPCFYSTATIEMASVVRHDNLVVGSASKDRSTGHWVIIPFTSTDAMRPYLNPKAIDRKEFRVFYSQQELEAEAV